MIQLSVSQIEMIIDLVECESQQACSDGNLNRMHALDRLHAQLSVADGHHHRMWRMGVPRINLIDGYQAVYTVFCYDPDDQTHILVHTASSIDKALIWCAENALDGFLAENNPHGSLSIVEDYVDRADDECRFVVFWHYLAGELMVSMPNDLYEQHPEWMGNDVGVEIEDETYYW